MQRDLSDISAAAFSKLSGASPPRIRPTQLNCIRMLLDCIREQAPNNFWMHSGWLGCNVSESSIAAIALPTLSSTGSQKMIVYCCWDLGSGRSRQLHPGAQPITFGCISSASSNCSWIVGCVGPSKSGGDWCRLI